MKWFNVSIKRILLLRFAENYDNSDLIAIWKQVEHAETFPIVLLICMKYIVFL